ncbi:TerC family protein [Singulisphaera sp. Ch08]|uniref:TerC family protein n=1 Tax=Singulisphaera sp. Ch08 TaxID=3120278 RepID=A0AAU7CR12_9BACT
MDFVLENLPQIAGTIVALVFLEGLLSADNALVLAVMVRHLPKDEQKRALRYGIFGAFVFRLIAVVLSAALLRFWHFKVAGGLYLLYLAISHFTSRDEDQHLVKSSRFGRGFWPTVVAVEFADIAFSIDSIVAAVAMAPKHYPSWLQLTIVYSGGILGIITMRYVAGYFIILLERFKGLASGAYYLVAWIGLKLVVGGLHTAGYLKEEMPEWLFWGGMLTIIAACLLYKPTPKIIPTEPMEEVVEVGQIGEGNDSTPDDQPITNPLN